MSRSRWQWLKSSCWSRQFSLVLSAWLLEVACLAQTNHPPSIPGAMTLSDITLHSARISWGAATDPDGDALSYRVSLRARLNGVAQSWSEPQAAGPTSLVWDGLLAGTVYDVKIAAFDGQALGQALVRENAFSTLSEVAGNHPPTVPGDIQISEITAHGARLAWGASSDPDGDPVSYQVSLRSRANGTVADWSSATNASSASLAWSGLTSETVYDVRVRASDGKSFSNWRLKESAFQTTPENNAPGKPGAITVSEVTSVSARIAWEPATGPAGVSLAYSLQVRPRINGVAQSWKNAGETTNDWLAVSGLTPATVYDVQVRAWAHTVAGAWDLKENAFQTLGSGEANHAPSMPGPLTVSEVSPYSARLAWGASTDPDGDALTYFICLRQRVNGVAQPWSAPRQVQQLSLLWDGLSPNTLYEVRVQAWDGKVASNWYVKEGAFQTPAVEHLASFLQPPDPTQPTSAAKLLVVWPNATGAQVLETTDSLQTPTWGQCQEVETDGSQTHSTVPVTSNAKFFRIR